MSTTSSQLDLCVASAGGRFGLESGLSMRGRGIRVDDASLAPGLRADSLFIVTLGANVRDSGVRSPGFRKNSIAVSRSQSEDPHDRTRVAARRARGREPTCVNGSSAPCTVATWKRSATRSSKADPIREEPRSSKIFARFQNTNPAIPKYFLVQRNITVM